MANITLSEEAKRLLLKAAVCVLLFVAGCLCGKKLAPSPAGGIDSVQTVESWHADTIPQAILQHDSGAFTLKGQKQKGGKVVFSGPIKTAHGSTQISAEFDSATNSLSGALFAIIELRVPQVILTHSTSTVIPYKVFVPSEGGVSGWTWVGVGAALGGLVTALAFILLHL